MVGRRELVGCGGLNGDGVGIFVGIYVHTVNGKGGLACCVSFIEIVLGIYLFTCLCGSPPGLQDPRRHASTT